MHKGIMLWKQRCGFIKCDKLKCAFQRHTRKFKEYKFNA